MSTLAARQSDFMASLLDDERALPAGWSPRHAAGLDIYRNNYRTALVEALRSTFERTERLVGEASFARAAAHHLITHPPVSWTLDLAGQGFAETCAELFANDPEVGELAQLEWSMHLVFVARDATPLTAEKFISAASKFVEDDWTGLTLEFLPGLVVFDIRHDLKALWSSLAEGADVPLVELTDSPLSVIVWREDERPVFILVPQVEGAALRSMQAGEAYGQVCETMLDQIGDVAIEMAGAMLQRWLREGLVAAIA